MPAYGINFEMLNGDQSIYPVSNQPVTLEEFDSALRTKLNITSVAYAEFENMSLMQVNDLANRVQNFKRYLTEKDEYIKFKKRLEERFREQQEESVRRTEGHAKIKELFELADSMPAVSLSPPVLANGSKVSAFEMLPFGIMEKRYVLATNLFKRVPNNGPDRGYYDCVPSTNQIDIHDFKKPESDQEKLIYDELVKTYRGKMPIKLSKEYREGQEEYIPVIKDPLNLLKVTSYDMTGIGYGGIYITAYINKNKLAK
jgi:hypothetical protein